MYMIKNIFFLQGVYHLGIDKGVKVLHTLYDYKRISTLIGCVTERSNVNLEINIKK